MTDLPTFKLNRMLKLNRIYIFVVEFEYFSIAEYTVLILKMLIHCTSSN